MTIPIDVVPSCRGMNQAQPDLSMEKLVDQRVVSSTLSFKLAC